jgi:polyisoprenyl-phosphate glycosyltransferase
MNKISIVVSVYNEEDNIRIFLQRLEKTLNRIKLVYEIIFVLDPCDDNSEKIIKEEINRNKNIKLIVFSRRFGQPAATMAGIEYASGDRCVIIDCDLQDPPELIEEMNNKINEGYDAVMARRKSRKGETFLKKIITQFGYLFINKISDVNIPKNTGDFRIISSRIINNLKNINEPNAFLRGLVAYIGFKQTFIDYDRDERYLGTSKYNKYLGSIKIAFNGIFGFSSKPIFFMSILGFVFAIVSFLIGIYYIIIKFTNPDITPGLSSTILFITFFSGLNLLGLGILGEYVGRIYDEVKGRPNFIIDKKFNFDE